MSFIVKCRRNIHSFIIKRSVWLLSASWLAPSVICSCVKPKHQTGGSSSIRSDSIGRSVPTLEHLCLDRCILCWCSAWESIIWSWGCSLWRWPLIGCAPALTKLSFVMIPADYTVGLQAIFKPEGLSVSCLLSSDKGPLGCPYWPLIGQWVG